jgi:hypothetical protein
MAGTPDLFVICKKCGSEVSPYITECPYCGTRLRKRAPKIDRREGEARPKVHRRTPRPSLTPLRHGEIPGIRADASRKPIVTMVLVLLSLFGFLALTVVDRVDLLLVSLHSDLWHLAATAFVYANLWYELPVVLALGIFGWRLELRHGPLLVIALFLAGGFGANALAVLAGDSLVLPGAPGAALAMIAAWALPDVLRARRGIDHEADLLGSLVIAVVILVAPFGVPEASILAGPIGLGIGLLTGLVLLRTDAAGIR